MALVVVERRRVSILGARALDLESLRATLFTLSEVGTYESRTSAPIEFHKRSESLIVQAAPCGIHASGEGERRRPIFKDVRPLACLVHDYNPWVPAERGAPLCKMLPGMP